MVKRSPPEEWRGPAVAGPLFAASAPYQAHSPTSRAAAAEILPETSRLRRRVLEHLAASGGSTDEEGQEALGMTGNTYRPRRRELEQAGLVAESGLHRKTKSGRLAVVWTASTSGS